MDASDSHDLDLPLMSNIEDIYVKHYMLDLLCDFDAKIFSGSVTLFCERKRETHQRCNVILKLKAYLSRNISVEDDQKIEDDKLQRDVSLEHSYLYDKKVSHEHNYSRKILSESKTVSVPSPEPAQNRCVNHFSENLDRTKFSHSEVEDCSHQCDTIDSDVKVKAKVEGDGIETKHSMESEDLPAVCKEFDGEFADQLKNVVMVLDSWDLDVEAVCQLCVPPDVWSSSNETDLEKLKEFIMTDSLETKPLCFTNEKKCLKIWKDGLTHWEDFPLVIRIQYKTRPSGQSLKWTTDQDGKPCVYTHGHWINNRSLFPSQDVPVAMATWSAYIHVQGETVVLMSADENPTVSACTSRQDYRTYHYHTSMEMPSSTLALAVGHWTQVDIIDTAEVAKYRDLGTSVLPCRLFSPDKHLETARALLRDYLPGCMEGAQWLLGPHPFSRLDILVVPSSFSSLGMASPSLMFLSQSVLSSDGGMLVRVAHELSHSWFGLLIGPQDWHEEWLSEGFCTYTEGIIHARCMQWTEEETSQQAQLQDYLKYKTLEAEINTTQHELQTLRYEEKTSTDDGVTYVKNGMNPDKGFMQVHYLKGYFLLRFLEAQVDPENFRTFLRSAVMQFHHKLITSDEVFSLFLKTFPQDKLSGITRESLQAWLDKPGIPEDLHQPGLEDITFAKPVIGVVKRVQRLQQTYSKLHWRKRQKLDLISAFRLPKLIDCQVLFLLEQLLDEDKVHPDILTSLNLALKLDTSYPDVLHRWCELVVKHRVETSYKDVEQFLINHQAMGVYLFGELMVTRDPAQRRLALATFARIKHDMEEGAFKTVSVMLCVEPKNE